MKHLKQFMGIETIKALKPETIKELLNKQYGRIKELEQGLESLLQEPSKRDENGIEFFLSKGNILPNGDMTSFLYGAKKYHDYLEEKITKL